MPCQLVLLDLNLKVILLMTANGGISERTQDFFLKSYFQLWSIHKLVRLYNNFFSLLTIHGRQLNFFVGVIYDLKHTCEAINMQLARLQLTKCEQLFFCYVKSWKKYWTCFIQCVNVLWTYVCGQINKLICFVLCCYISYRFDTIYGS